MSDVLITLKLKRRSGVLAAAIAALGRSGMEFRSQRLAEVDSTPCLFLTAAGQVTDVEAIVQTFGGISAVLEVVDISVDGASLLHALEAVDEHEQQAEPEQLRVPEFPEPDRSEPDDIELKQAEPQALSDEPLSGDSDQQDQSKPQSTTSDGSDATSDAAIEPAWQDVSEVSAEPEQHSEVEGPANKEEVAAERGEDPDQQEMLRRAMLRRRRRRR